MGHSPALTDICPTPPSDQPVTDEIRGEGEASPGTRTTTVTVSQPSGRFCLHSQGHGTYTTVDSDPDGSDLDLIGWKMIFLWYINGEMFCCCQTLKHIVCSVLNVCFHSLERPNADPVQLLL